MREVMRFRLAATETRSFGRRLAAMHLTLNCSAPTTSTHLPEPSAYEPSLIFSALKPPCKTLPSFLRIVMRPVWWISFVNAIHDVSDHLHDAHVLCMPVKKPKIATLFLYCITNSFTPKKTRKLFLTLWISPKGHYSWSDDCDVSL